MTTYEHAMLGVSGTLAAGLHRRYGWPIVALGGFVAALPDWDGLSIVFGARPFDHVHRTVGHSLLICVLLGAAVAAADWRFGLAERIKALAGRGLRLFAPESPPATRHESRRDELAVWVGVGVAASLSHLAADLVFSGHETLSDWGLRLFWPFSDQVWAYPVVPWGDAGVTVIFVAGMFAMLRWPSRLQMTAGLTLGVVLAYIVLRAVTSG